MAKHDALRAYYEANPLMVSSPFGGVDGVNEGLVREVFGRLDVAVAGKAILDVGCGRGYAGEIVKELGGQYVGADLVASRPGFAFVAAEGGCLPFGDESFDGVFCVDAFEHFPDGAAAASEFRRVVKPGGFLFLSVPNYGNVAGLVKWWCEHLGRYAPDSWAPFRNWQPQELEHFVTNGRVQRLFERAGFRTGACAGHGAEVGLGLFPWMEHARMPEAIKFRLQRFFRALGPGVARAWPGASLHSFWRFDA